MTIRNMLIESVGENYGNKYIYTRYSKKLSMSDTKRKRISALLVVERIIMLE